MDNDCAMGKHVQVMQSIKTAQTRTSVMSGAATPASHPLKRPHALIVLQHQLVTDCHELTAYGSGWARPGIAAMLTDASFPTDTGGGPRSFKEHSRLHPSCIHHQTTPRATYKPHHTRADGIRADGYY